ncbi:MAG: Uma2 family endonuclease [Pirellulales bacterium]|nr:Uma2 family endonuclease [Pirellulales bacterium]
MATVTINAVPSTTLADNDGIAPMAVRLAPLIQLDDQAFMQLADQNPDYRFEQNSAGELVIMAPTGGDSGNQNFDLLLQLGMWHKKHKLGKCFDSSTMFVLPNRARRSPDASWVANSRWNALTKEQQRSFPPICPDFVIELRSPSDQLHVLTDKMAEYLANGAQLGWLIDPRNKTVHVYRPGSEPVILQSPPSVSGEPLLPGFTLDTTELFSISVE